MADRFRVGFATLVGCRSVFTRLRVIGNFADRRDDRNGLVPRLVSFPILQFFNLIFRSSLQQGTFIPIVHRKFTDDKRYVNRIEPERSVYSEFTKKIDTALELDSKRSSHPVQVPSESPREIGQVRSLLRLFFHPLFQRSSLSRNQSFDQLSYEKAASGDVPDDVLLMRGILTVMNSASDDIRICRRGEIS